MKKLLPYFLYFILIISSCSKEDDNAARTSAIEVNVTNSSGTPQSGIKVYLFKDPSTEPAGQDPSKALKSVSTDSDGKARFELQTLPSFNAGEIIYFTTLEKSFTGQYLVTGTTDLTIDNKQETVTAGLAVSSLNPEYQHGFKPSAISSSLVVDEYNRWKSLMIVPCNDGLRPITDDPGKTLVEAMGFGMLVSAYANDKTTFDGLHKFYNSKRTPQAKNLMAWSVTCNGITDTGNATDGDVDVAFALIVASKQWGGTYLESAKQILQIIKDNLIVQCTSNGQNVLVLGPGYNSTAWGGCGLMDIMYHTPAFFRVFAAVTGDNTWSQLADDTYVTLNASANATTGLVPDWQTADGVPGPQGRVGNFAYDACRAPWRITLDYLWNGNAKAEAWAKKISTWANQVGPAKIVDGYKLDGTPIGQNGLNSAFLGGFSVAAMANSQATVNNFGQELAKLKDTYWFNLDTRILYLFTLSGNFWDPLKK